MGLLRPDQSLIVEQPVDASELTEVPPVVEAIDRSLPSADLPERSATGSDFADVPDVTLDPATPAPTPTPTPNRAPNGGPENLLPNLPPPTQRPQPTPPAAAPR